MGDQAGEPGATPANGASSGVDELTTVVGGTYVDVEYLPADAFDPEELKRLEKFKSLLGTKDRVKVRQIRVDEAQLYGNAVIFNDEATQIELYCGKEKGWATTLTLPSADAIADAGQALNLPFFVRWYRRQRKAKDLQAPTAMQDLQEKFGTLQKQLAQLISQKSAGASPSSTG
jgi:hypothetical protein